MGDDTYDRVDRRCPDLDLDINLDLDLEVVWSRLVKAWGRADHVPPSAASLAQLKSDRRQITRASAEHQLDLAMRRRVGEVARESHPGYRRGVVMEAAGAARRTALAAIRRARKEGGGRGRSGGRRRWGPREEIARGVADDDDDDQHEDKREDEHEDEVGGLEEIWEAFELAVDAMVGRSGSRAGSDAIEAGGGGGDGDDPGGGRERAS